MRAADIMTRSPVAVSCDTRIGEAVAVMDAVDVHLIPVLDCDELVGVLSDRDLHRLWEPHLDGLNVAPDPRRTVAEVMTRDPVTVSEQAEVDAVIHVLVAQRLAAVPVVDGDGALVGVVTAIDVLRAAEGRLG